MLPNVAGIATFDMTNPVHYLAATGYLYWQVHLQGYPGYLGPYGYGVPLVYTSNASVQTANTNTACGNFTPLYAGDQCDEYPFKSTTNGASGKQYGVGWGRCSIPGDQNGQAGSVLASAYRLQHITDGDNFYAQVVGDVALPPVVDRCTR